MIRHAEREPDFDRPYVVSVPSREGSARGTHIKSPECTLSEVYDRGITLYWCSHCRQVVYVDPVSIVAELWSEVRQLLARLLRRLLQQKPERYPLDPRVWR